MKHFEKKAFKIAVYGRSRSGKSHTVKQMIDDARFNRQVCFDATGEYKFLKGWKECQSLKEFLKGIQQGWNTGFKISYNPLRDIDSGVFKDRIEALHQFSELIRAIQHNYRDFLCDKKMLLIVDEMSKCFPNGIPRQFNGFEYLCSEGSHYGIDIIGTTQRPASVNTHWKGNMTASVFFACSSPLDAEYGGELVSRANRNDVEQRLLALQDRHYIEIKNGIASESVHNDKGYKLPSP